MTEHHSGRDRVTVIFFSISSGSMPLNQHRSQLSFVYWTTSRKGGEVTVSCTESSGIPGVFLESEQKNRADLPISSRIFTVSGVRFLVNDRVFFSSISRVFRYPGDWPLRMLILLWPSRLAAWFGGSV
jgi:hypothetical protein